jgi:GTP-binding protein YchF
VKVPDPRVLWLAELYKPKKTTLAELELIDLPGFDLTDEAGRQRAKTHWPAMRNADMLVFVVRGFANDSVGLYRDRINPAADVDELLSEMLFADLDQVTNRVGRLEAAIKKPSPHRDEQQRELDLMKRLSAALEGGQPVADAVHNDAEAKMLRSFAFLSQKPTMAVLNCSEDAANAAAPDKLGPVPCLQLSVKIEKELAELPPDERAVFLADLGLTAAASDRMVQACYQRLKLVSFLTAGEDECRAWTIPAGTDAVTAASAIHSDIARGFIRAETVSFDDLKSHGDMKGAKAAGRIRLEGKSYIVQDGDIINFRFAV